MKTDSIVKLTRGSKTIVIYINGCDWEDLSDLFRIVDVEIYDNDETDAKDDEE